MIGDNIELVVVGIDGEQIKLGIKAPKDVKIYRHEIFEAIQNENRQALNIDADLLNQLKNF